MSARFKASYSEGIVVTDFEVDITHDLEMIFANYDFAHDQAAHEFGYPKTSAMRFAEAWQSDPMNVVELYLVIPRLTIMLVSCDWADHVLPIFEERAPKRVRNKPRMVVEAARQHFLNAIKHNTIKKIKIGIKLQDAALKAKTAASGYAGYAAEVAAQAALRVADSIALHIIDTSPDVSDSAAAAFAWYDPNPNIFPDADTRKIRKEEEYFWQVTRLIYVVEALQAGKPIPPLEATP